MRFLVKPYNLPEAFLEKFLIFTDGCIIPEGAEVIDSLWGACRSRESWGEDAEEFIPERFFREIQPADPAAFATFSYGRRMCIGKFYIYKIHRITTLTYF